jgi:microcystin-dependent protein
MQGLFLGQIVLASFDFVPQGLLACNGQLLSIAQNQALFALIGTKFGGNGETDFALPDYTKVAPPGSHYLIVTTGTTPPR